MTGLRLAMISQGYASQSGASERDVSVMAPLLKARGLNVCVLTRRHPDLPSFEMLDQVPVYRLPGSGPEPVAAASFILTALARLLRLRPQIIHAQELFSATTAAILAQRWLGCRVVVTVRGSGGLSEIRRLNRQFLGPQRLRYFRQKVDRFICVSRLVQSELQAAGFPGSKLSMLPPGIDTARFTPASPETRLALRQALGLPQGLLIVSTGRLTLEKRMDRLIDIWSRILRVYPQASLLIAGRSSAREKELEMSLRQAAGPGIQFLTIADDVRPYLRAADIFVLPSDMESLPLALLEAMACGLPVLATQVGATAEVITNRENGWLTSPDTEAFCQDLLLLLGQADLRRRLGAAARQRIENAYALPVIAGKLQAIYQQLIEQ